VLGTAAKGLAKDRERAARGLTFVHGDGYDSHVRGLVAISVLLFATTAGAAVRKDFPYPGSVYESVDKTPAPLLVVLHGDNQQASTMRAAWSAPAAKRAISVLYLQCPKALGCKGSFWSWNGEPKFIDDAVDALGKDVDPDRVWIAGWSGGASYLGMRAFDLSDKYAALSFNGGGLSPLSSNCPSRVLPAYFLVGDKNPLHHLAKELRASLGGCNAEVVWDLRPGADHSGEWKALEKDADKVLAWLEVHPRPRPPPIASSASASAPAPPEPDAGVTVVSATPAPPAPVRCACRAAGARAEFPRVWLFALLAVMLGRGRLSVAGR
jgi:hypothetical protein